MAGHDPRHDELLERALVEARMSDVDALIAACPTCRRSWEELERVRRGLDDLGGELGADLRDGERPAPGEELVAATVAALAAGDRPRARTRARRAVWLAPLLAAAAIAAFFWIRRPVQPTDDVELGPRAIELVAPLGSLVGAPTFEARARRPTDGFFRFRVFEPGASEPLLESPLLDAARWTPSPAEHARLPRRFEWQLEVQSTGAGSMHSERALVERVD